MTSIVLVYGANGWIGGQFCDLICGEATVVKGQARVDDYDALRAEVLNACPDFVISFIGRTHGTIGSKHYPTIDYLEQPGKLTENVRDNLFGPLQLALLCMELDIHFTYLGTGCIFNYAMDEEGNVTSAPIKDDAAPNFFGSSYSIVKGFTDRLFHTPLLAKTSLNVRIRMPIIGEQHPRNFITKIANYKRICSMPNSMTVLPDLLPILWHMMKNKVVHTINLVNPGSIDHNTILRKYQERVDPTLHWENFTVAEQRAALAADRSNNILDTKVLEAYCREYQLELPTIEQSIDRLLSTFTSHH
jgi:3,5-epimerase/4-reductase